MHVNLDTCQHDPLGESSRTNPQTLPAIGLTTAKAALTGVETPGGFAIPISAAMGRIIDVLKRGEEVEYGFLGVQLLY